MWTGTGLGVVIGRAFCAPATMCFSIGVGAVFGGMEACF